MRFPLLRSKSAVKDDRPAPVAEPGSVQLARIHARRRLVGALVLLVAGIAVFPVLFETQPRPIAVDTPIVMPAREPPSAVGGPVDRAPVNVPPADAGIESPASVPAWAASAPRALPTVQSLDPAPAPASAEPAAAAALAVVVAAAPSAAKPAPAAAKPAVAASRPDDGARAQDLLDGRSVASEPKPDLPRFVVQAGAYSEAGALREARQKVEKLGLKTYTQVVEGDGGRRTRVRVGPFATRQEAEGAAAKVKAAGLQASILAL